MNDLLKASFYDITAFLIKFENKVQYTKLVMIWNLSILLILSLDKSQSTIPKQTTNIVDDVLLTLRIREESSAAESSNAEALFSN